MEHSDRYRLKQVYLFYGASVAYWLNTVLLYKMNRLVILLLVTFTHKEAMATVGDVPELLEVAVQQQAFKLGGSSLINLWDHGERLQAEQRSGPNTVPKPLTLVAPDSGRMTNLVPQDVGHPLYHSGPKYTAMRHSFLLDSMVEERVDPADPRMATEAGLTVNTMNGRPLVFKRSEDGKLLVNDIPVDTQQKLLDGTELYVLNGILFSYVKEVDDAFNEMIAEGRRNRGSGGGCFMGGCK